MAYRLTSGCFLRRAMTALGVTTVDFAESELCQRQLNERPRETLTFETPAERFNAFVASTG